MHREVDAISDAIFAQQIGDGFCESAEELGLTPKQLYKLIIPALPLSLTTAEMEYGKKVAARLEQRFRNKSTLFRRRAGFPDDTD